MTAHKVDDLLDRYAYVPVRDRIFHLGELDLPLDRVHLVGLVLDGEIRDHLLHKAIKSRGGTEKVVPQYGKSCPVAHFPPARGRFIGASGRFSSKPCQNKEIQKIQSGHCHRHVRRGFPGYWLAYVVRHGDLECRAAPLGR